MRINKKSQPSLYFGKWHEDRIIRERLKVIHENHNTTEEKENAIHRINSVVPSHGSAFYIPADTVIKLSNRIKIKETFDFTFLSTVQENKKITFMMGDMFYRWVKIDNKITVLACCMMPIDDSLKSFYPPILTHDISYLLFSFDTELNAMSFPDDFAKPFTMETIMQFIRLLIFTELSEIETVFLKPNQSVGTKRSGKTKNDTDKNIVLIDSLWNKNIVITDEFLVSGHFRLQPKGIGRLQRELIWIDTYKKKGYKKIAKKLTI